MYSKGDYEIFSQEFQNEKFDLVFNNFEYYVNVDNESLILINQSENNKKDVNIEINVYYISTNYSNSYFVKSQSNIC